jgi:hypothetical protein
VRRLPHTSGPVLPNGALRDCGCFLGCSGRTGNVVGMALVDPTPTCGRKDGAAQQRPGLADRVIMVPLVFTLPLRPPGNSRQTGTMPPFGLIRFLEAIGVASVQPQLMSAASLLDSIEEPRAIGADAFERLLADGFEAADDYFFVDSWFEAGDKVDAVLKGTRHAPGKREALIMEKVLEPRREWWTQLTALGGLDLVSG